MSAQAVVPFHINGESFFTHTSWFSERQYNSWSQIPPENKNLAYYFSLSTVSVLAIFLRKSSLVKRFTTSYGRILTGVAASVGGSYLGFLAILKSGENSEIERVVSKNQCGSTPLWRKEQEVVNLRELDYKTFMSRKEGHKYNVKDVEKYKPHGVLLGSEAGNSIEKLI